MSRTRWSTTGLVLAVTTGLAIGAGLLGAAPAAKPGDEGATAAPAPVSQRAGYVPNAFTDAKLDAPLLKTQNVYDLYAGIVSYLLEVYPKEGAAHQALDKFRVFVEGESAAYRQNPESARPYRMPMSIDQLMKYLNEGASEGNSPIAATIGDNAKAQLYVSSILPLIHLRGITYRMRPMVEQSFVVHSTIIGAMRSLKQQLDVTSGANGRAVFDFMTFPMSFSERSQVQFATVSDFQTWLVQSFIPTLDHSILIAEKVAASLPESFRESLDMQIFLKADQPFPNDSMEAGHRWFGAAEVQFYLGQLYAARAALHGLCTYNLDDYAAATNEISNTLLKDFLAEKVSFGSKPRVGTPSFKRFQILEKYSKLWTLKSPEQSQAALADVRKAVENYDKAMHGFFQATANDGGNRLAIIRYFQSSYKEYEQKLAPQLRAVVAGPATLTDYVGGSTVDIDLAGFMTNPPADLKVFFPEKYDTTNKYVELQSAGDNLVYTNYDYGRPLSWKLSAASDGWGKLFPNMKKSANKAGQWDGPLVTFRDLSRTYVGYFLAPLLSGAIF
ncbi:MAG: hypothetical protein HY303_12785 [Candidatus Wallbacteria bacterium]|nr:hypothetical protein [Candidatus Wallbacteria bacterium]